MTEKDLWSEPPIYQHRLTEIGMYGAAMAIICPIILSALLPDYLFASRDKPSSALIIILALASQIGLLLIFVGREYRPVSSITRREEDEKRAAQDAKARSNTTPSYPPADLKGEK